MLQNIKTDVIYYKTGTDFEMEFNLCGCCRMRLLTDKIADKKALIHSMARAVSRSRIIIIVGSLFGEDSIINLAAGAIGKKLAEADNKAFGIAGEEKIEIIEGSTPLVTTEGYFGGCIIESGPQTMIMVSDSKNVRKNIMLNLIHPYIAEVSALGSAEIKAEALPEELITEANEAEAITEAETEELELIADNIEENELLSNIEEDIELLDNDYSQDIVMAESETSDELVLLDADPEAEENKAFYAETDSENDIIMTNEMLFDFEDEEEPHENNNRPEEEEEIELFTATRPAKSKLKEEEAPFYGDLGEDSDLISDEEDGIFPQRPARKRASLNIPILVITILLLIALAVLCYCIFYVPSKDGVTATAYIRETFEILFG